MDTLTSLKIFCQIVERGNFTRAAEYLNISTAMASKHLSHLEKKLGIRLMQRNSRNLSLTTEGEIYYQECRNALELLENAAAQASSGKEKPRGLLRFTAPIWCANPVFARWMNEYHHHHPEVSLDIVLDNSMRDLVSDGFDLALRVSKTPTPTLIVRPLFPIHFALVASPIYLKQHGIPRSAKEAEKHAAILPSYTDISKMTCNSPEGKETLHLQNQLQSNNTLMLYQLILEGGGIGYLPHWLIENDLAAGRLTRLLPEYHFETAITLYAAYPHRRHLSAKIRSFIDFLIQKVQDISV